MSKGTCLEWNGGSGMSTQMRQMLRETYTYRRVVGFGDAVADLGTHRICGIDTQYSKQAVYNVLHGRSASRKLIARIVKRRPDLLDLSFVSDETRKVAREYGWRPGMWIPSVERAGKVGEDA